MLLLEEVGVVLDEVGDQVRWRRSCVGMCVRAVVVVMMMVMGRMRRSSRPSVCTALAILVAALGRLLLRLLLLLDLLGRTLSLRRYRCRRMSSSLFPHAACSIETRCRYSRRRRRSRLFRRLSRGPDGHEQQGCLVSLRLRRACNATAIVRTTRA